MKRLTFYSKPQCSLCDDAKDVIDQAREQIAFELCVRNILDDVGDYELYKHDIPVILLDDRELARHRLNLPQLIAALQESAD